MVCPVSDATTERAGIAPRRYAARVRENRARRASAVAAALLVAACRGHGSERAPDPGESAQEPTWPGLTLELTPDPDHDDVAVLVRISGERAHSVREIAAARTWADTRGGEA